MSDCVIITGASHGIGKSTAQQFSSLKWNVINLSRTSCDIANVQNIPVDFSDPAWPKMVTDELLALVAPHQKLCIVHNAAMLQKDTIYNLDGTAFAKVLQLNVIAPQQLNHLLLPTLPKTSSIIYVASTLATKGVRETASYIASKHALLGLMRATMHDTADKGIHTVCICPGATNTTMLQTHTRKDPVTMNALKRLSAFNRLVEPEEIAATIHFAATQPVLNGAVLHANLGQLG